MYKSVHHRDTETRRKINAKGDIERTEVAEFTE
jgi:hypothetical protein